MALRPRPTELPPEVLPVVIGVLRGEEFDADKACHCLEETISYGTGRWFAEAQPRGASVEALSRKQAADMLDSFNAGQHGRSAMPWASLLQLLIPLLLEWITKKK